MGVPENQLLHLVVRSTCVVVVYVPSGRREKNQGGIPTCLTPHCRTRLLLRAAYMDRTAGLT